MISSIDILFNSLTNKDNLNALLKDPNTFFDNNNIPMEDRKKILGIIDISLKLSNERENQIQFLKDQQQSTADTAHAFKEGLQNSLNQIESGFLSSMLMYKIAFYLGVGLIVISVIYAIFDKSSLLPIIFGSVGTIDLLGFFITKPPQNIQASRADLAQLQAAFTNWFFDTYNWNSYLLHLDKTNQISFEEMKNVSDALLNSTNKTMSLIEKYCEFKK